MSKRRILVVEDDDAIRTGIVDSLTFGDYEVLEASNGTDGVRMAVRGGYDLLLLDLVLPGPGGLQILAEVRTSRPTIPVIILTARGDESDRVKGLKLGADDYVVKPFSVKELMARVEAVLRRSPERPTDVEKIPFPGGTADMSRGEIRFKDGSRCELSEREMELLRYLAGNRGRAISREEILRRVWRIDPDKIETRTIDMHVARLREKLRDDPAEPGIITTVRGKGYMYAVPKVK
ncbi:MAG: response regulator transcription factor [Lentisphaerales bacterium]|jgi:DNA-binding response OmpR family regulator|nr:MAG: response regulator transcription factor [Lentisphaerales bacterium]